MEDIVVYVREGEKIEREVCSSNLKENMPNNYSGLDSFLEDINHRSRLELYLFDFTPEDEPDSFADKLFYRIIGVIILLRILIGNIYDYLKQRKKK